MAAQILELPVERRRGRRRRPSTPIHSIAVHADRMQFWRGASGRSYPHTVYGLIECPPVPAAVYVMVGYEGKAKAKALRVGRVDHAAESLNLAELRRIGATLGADEIHLHLIAGESTDALAIELDLKAASQDDVPASGVRRAAP